MTIRRHNLKQLATAMLLAVVCLIHAAGCRQLNVPAIDPTGERIFAPGSTSLAGPCQGGLLPTPAFERGPDIPDCPPELATTPVLVDPGTGTPMQPPVIVGPEFVAPEGQPFLPGAVVEPAPTLIAPTVACPTGTIVMTPVELIAHVGSEVILQAGLCGGDGFYRTQEPIEWILSRESVGQLVGVGSEPRPQFCSLLNDDSNRPLRTGDYALTRTLVQPRTLDRGTPDQSDDVVVKSGQAWVSVSSAASGVSRVTATAPDSSTGGAALKTTAVVHWIDAQWVVPPPVIVGANGQHTLTTSLSRATSRAPIAGWIVRYQVVDGTPAQFVSYQGDTGNTADAVSDAAGSATVTLAPAGGQSGTTRIKVSIIRPESIDGNTPALTVGEGFTSITWSAPGLTTTLTGPEMMQAGETGNYRIEVTNPGDVAITNVDVTHEMPAGFAYLGGNPAGQVFGNRVQFRFPNIGAHSSQAIDLQLQANTGGDVQHVTRAQAAEGIAATAQMITRVFQNSLGIATAGPESAQVGDEVTFRVRVRNQGNLPLNNVVVTDFLGAGLQHVAGVNKIDKQLGRIEARSDADFAVTFTVTQPGQLCHQLQVVADGGHHATTQGCVNVTQPPPPPQQPTPPPEPQRVPNMSVRVDGPATATVGDVINFDAVVANTGEVDLTNIRILANWDTALLVSSVDAAGYRQRGRDIYWVVPRIPPASEVRISMKHVCQSPSNDACHRIAVLCNEITQQQEDMACVRVIARATATPPSTTPGTTTPRTQPGGSGVGGTPPIPDLGSLEVTVANLNNPVRVGGTVNYLVVIKNNRQASDRNVALRVQLPRGMTLTRVSEGPTTVASQDAASGLVRFSPITELRANETVTYKFELTATTPGAANVTVDVSSQRQTNPVIKTDSVSVN